MTIINRIDTALEGAIEATPAPLQKLVVYAIAFVIIAGILCGIAFLVSLAASFVAMDWLMFPAGLYRFCLIGSALLALHFVVTECDDL